MMANPVHIAMYSDVHCPYAYLTAFRLRKLRNEYRGHIVIEHKSLSLEYVNKRFDALVVHSLIPEKPVGAD